MNCEECMSALALEDGNSELNEHLRQCPACREYATAMEADRQVLATLRDVDPLALFALRRGVSARIAKEQAVRRAWAWSAGLAACLAGAFSILALSVPEATPPMPDASFRAAGPPSGWDARTISRPVRRRPAPTRELAKAAPPLKIKILTDDANVVIYWLVDNEGGD